MIPGYHGPRDARPRRRVSPRADAAAAAARSPRSGMNRHAAPADARRAQFADARAPDAGTIHATESESRGPGPFPPGVEPTTTVPLR